MTAKNVSQAVLVLALAAGCLAANGFLVPNTVERHDCTDEDNIQCLEKLPDERCLLNQLGDEECCGQWKKYKSCSEPRFVHCDKLKKHYDDIKDFYEDVCLRTKCIPNWQCTTEKCDINEMCSIKGEGSYDCCKARIDCISCYDDAPEDCYEESNWNNHLVLYTDHCTKQTCKKTINQCDDEPYKSVCKGGFTDKCCEMTHEYLDCATDVFSDCQHLKQIHDEVDVHKAIYESSCQHYIQRQVVECFPADATVELRGGGRIRMSELKAGDTVRVGPEAFSDVYMFTHRDLRARTTMVRIEAGKHVLELSPGHYVPSNGKLVAAREVAVGDVVSAADGTRHEVSSVRKVRKVGLVNPQTIQGDIVVNNVVASTFTQAVHPTLARALLLIPKTLYRLFGAKNVLGSALHADNAWIARWVLSGPNRLQHNWS
mmetsp:Transcript_268/g.873  ORF Transcript_268/g.873 Transcript_268/m.873 type:complete len:429 (+) Transcript_268:158-1444(+)